MNRLLHPWRLRARILLVAGAACSRLAAADEPAAPASGTPAPAPAGSWFVFSPPKDDEVLPPQSRTKMLSLAKTFMERANPSLLDHLNAADNPFYAKAPPPPTPVAVNTTTSGPTPAEPAAPVQVTDEDKLKAIGEKLQPTGLLESGATRLVTLSGGGTLAVGQSFTATVPPENAVLNISLIDANDNECVLKLNSTTLSVSYVSKPVGGSHPPSPTSPSQPKP